VKNLGGAWHRMVRTNVLNIIEHSINIKALPLNPLPKGEGVECSAGVWAGRSIF
jgi:hypothetical protein